jgi:hypothetical protein
MFLSSPLASGGETTNSWMTFGTVTINMSERKTVPSLEKEALLNP